MKEAKTLTQEKPASKSRRLLKLQTFLTPPDELYSPDFATDSVFYCGTVLARIQLRYDNLDWLSYEAVNVHVQLLQLRGFQVKIEPLTIEIPNEYIGIEEHWKKTLLGEKLKSRKYLQIQVEHIERKTIVSQKPCFEVQQELHNEFRSNYP
jgi:hypothetical protein